MSFRISGPAGRGLYPSTTAFVDRLFGALSWFAFAVWTGTAAAGTPSGGTCGNWVNDNSKFGRIGYAERRDKQWTDVTDATCATTEGHLYCIEE